MRIIFMGTPAFAIPALKALISSAHEVVAVYSQPPRPAGRGMKLTPSPIQQLAEEHGIPVFVPTSLKSPEIQAEYAAHNADIAVVAAYGLLLPQAILDAPKFGCINIHPSDLPRWRGAAPIQHTIMAGDMHTACCIMQIEAGLDSGPVLSRTHYAIPAGTTTGLLHDTMAEMGATYLLEVLAAYAAGTPPTPQPQPTEGVTYANKITKADQPIDWQRSAPAILQQILGLSPSPGATTTINGELIKIYNAELQGGDPLHEPAIALDNALLFNTAAGTAVRFTELQRAGKPRQSAEQFLQAFPVATGSKAV